MRVPGGGVGGAVASCLLPTRKGSAVRQAFCACIALCNCAGAGEKRVKRLEGRGQVG